MFRGGLPGDGRPMRQWHQGRLERVRQTALIGSHPSSTGDGGVAEGSPISSWILDLNSALRLPDVHCAPISERRVRGHQDQRPIPTDCSWIAAALALRPAVLRGSGAVVPSATEARRTFCAAPSLRRGGSIAQWSSRCEAADRTIHWVSVSVADMVGIFRCCGATIPDKQLPQDDDTTARFTAECQSFLRPSPCLCAPDSDLAGWG
jgi:hypothetical protein